MAYRRRGGNKYNARKAVNLELESRLNYEILYFTAGNYGKYGTHWRKVGDHYFCTK